MSRVKARGTDLEQRVANALRAEGMTFLTNVRDLSGRPDFVLPDEGLVIFVDGDFWHGYQFPKWKARLSPFWQRKIQANRIRDRRTFGRLRRQRWKVLRLWQHEIEKRPEFWLRRVRTIVDSTRSAALNR